MVPVPAAISMAENWSPSLPQATRPMPGSSDAPTTAAPAPSAKITAVERSVLSTTSVSRSTPTTSTSRAEPARVAGEAPEGRAVGLVADGGEPLDADDQHVAGGARADGGRGRFQRVAEAGAAGVEVEGRRAGGAQAGPALGGEAP